MTLWQKLADLEARNERFVLATLVSSEGHSPQDPGAKCVITSGGLEAGTVGGGKIEAHVIATAQKLLLQSETELVAPKSYKWNLQRDIGMTCGGLTEFLFEVHPQWPWSIAIFGAGHVGQALSRALLPLNCRVTVIDDRPEWIEKLPKAPNIRLIRCEEMSLAVKDFLKNTFFVVMTRGHATDLPILQKIFSIFPESPYIGVMGSQVKAQKMRSDLLAAGVPADLIERLRSPIGFDIGTNDPSEIAISVSAQLLEVRDRWRSSSATTSPS